MGCTAQTPGSTGWVSYLVVLASETGVLSPLPCPGRCLQEKCIFFEASTFTHGSSFDRWSSPLSSGNTTFLFFLPRDGDATSYFLSVLLHHPLMGFRFLHHLNNLILYIKFILFEIQWFLFFPGW